MMQNQTDYTPSGVELFGRLRLTGVRILIVEDETVIAMELASLMEELGATVVGPANTFGSGLKHAKGDTISAAILDVHLGNTSVTPIARVLAGRAIPFVFYTGQPPSDPIYSEWPDCPTIGKPATAPKIVAAVADLLALTPTSRLVRAPVSRAH